MGRRAAVITVLVPVLGRPAFAEPLAASLAANTTIPHRLLFLCSPADNVQIRAARNTGADVIVVAQEPGCGDYARKINHGHRIARGEWLLMAADDIRFHPGWDEAVLAVAEQTGAGVIGTNDLGNPQVVKRKEFSTHPLIRRRYINQQGGSLDGPGVVLHEGYDHNFVDRELWDLATTRAQTAFATNSKIEHLHPHWRKGQMDATYEKGLKHFHDDQRLYWSRRKQMGLSNSAREENELKRWERRNARLGLSS